MAFLSGFSNIVFKEKGRRKRSCGEARKAEGSSGRPGDRTRCEQDRVPMFQNAFRPVVPDIVSGKRRVFEDLDGPGGQRMVRRRNNEPARREGPAGKKECRSGKKEKPETQKNETVKQRRHGLEPGLRHGPQD